MRRATVALVLALLVSAPALGQPQAGYHGGHSHGGGGGGGRGGGEVAPDPGGGGYPYPAGGGAYPYPAPYPAWPNGAPGPDPYPEPGPSGPPPSSPPSGLSPNAPPSPNEIAAREPSWFYCEAPRGFFPYVKACATAWRPTAVMPPPQGAPTPPPIPGLAHCDAPAGYYPWVGACNGAWSSQESGRPPDAPKGPAAGRAQGAGRALVMVPGGERLRTVCRQLRERLAGDRRRPAAGRPAALTA